MSCSKCNTSNTSCGCKDTPYTTPMPVNCQPDATCPTPSKCSEYMDASCVYLNDGIYDANIPPQTSIEEAIQQLTLMITNPECTDTDSCNCPVGTAFLVQTDSVNNSSQTELNNIPSYGMRITNPSVGNVEYEAVVNENFAIYVDLTYGQDPTGEKYNLVRPYATFDAAYSVASAGDIIVLNAGIYAIGTYVLTKPDVYIYCKPGVVFNNTGFSITSSSNLRFYGFAVFTGSGYIPLNINSTGQAQNIFFEFDKIDGAMSQAIYIKDATSTGLNVFVKGNEIRSTSTGNTHLVRVDNSNNTNVIINIANIISGSQRFIVRFGGFSASVPMIGNIVLNCPIIENTGSLTTRTCIYLDGVLSTQANDGYKIVVNSSIIRQTNPTMTDTGTDIISSCVWIDGGNNIYIKGDLEGNACLAVCNRGAGSDPHYGTIVFEGNMTSQIECISSCVKVNNGNGWHSIVVKNGVLVTDGDGNSIAVVDRPSVWNVVHGGVNGKLQFINTRFYNKNINVSASATSIISSGNDRSRTFLYDCLMYVDNAVAGSIETSNPFENVGMVNVRANAPLGTNVNDIYTGFTNTSALEIPEY